MIPKIKEKERAIKLRKDGKSYREILAEIPVAKSSLSLWLRGVGLSKPQKQRLTEKRLAAIQRGGASRHKQRVEITNKIKTEAHTEITKISRRDLWLIGIALYWAEGSKEKTYGWGQNVVFGNSDQYMIQVFLKWLTVCCQVPMDRIYFEIYVHDSHRERKDELRKYWAGVTKLNITHFDRVYFKRNKINTVRKNTGDLYHGLLRVRVNASSNFNRKITGWTEGLYCHISKIIK